MLILPSQRQVSSFLLFSRLFTQRVIFTNLEKFSRGRNFNTRKFVKLATVFAYNSVMGAVRVCCSQYFLHMVRGYHKYKDVLVATKGKRLLCHREVDNLYDLFIVVVIKNDYVVGHVPKKISTSLAGQTTFFFLHNEKEIKQSGLRD